MKKFLAFAMLICVSGVSHSLTFDQAMQLYVDGNYERAYYELSDLAQLGNTKAQVNVAVMYARGEFVEKDIVESLAWAHLAKRNGEPVADQVINALSGKLSQESQIEVDQRASELISMFDTASLKQKLVPNYTGGKSHFMPARVLKSEAAKYPKRELAKGNRGVVDVLSMVGVDGSTRFQTLLAAEEGAFEKSAIESYKKFIYQPASLGGRKVASFGVRNKFIFQLAGTEINAEKAQPFLDQMKKDAEAGGGFQKYSYARNISAFQKTLQGSKGYDEIEWDNSFEWLYESAKEGVALAKYELGLDSLHGNQCDSDEDMSLIWLTSAAKDGLADANMILGYEYIAGRRFTKDIKAGFELIEGAAKGLDNAKVLLAWLYATFPDETHRDFAKAKNLVSSVDEDEFIDLRSYFETVAAIELGLGNKKDAKKALKMLSKQNKKYETPRDRELALLEALESGRVYVEAL